MGSENSKPTKNDRQSAAPAAHTREEQEFQYGPRPNHQGHSNNAATRSQPANIVPPQQNINVIPALPPYFKTDVYNSRATNVQVSNANFRASAPPQMDPLNVLPTVPTRSAPKIPPTNIRQVSSSVQQPQRCAEPTRSNVSQPIAPLKLSQQIPPSIPPLPQLNRYKWTSSEVLAASQPLEVKTKPHSNRSTPKQTPSPGYDSLENPYVWVNKKSPVESSVISKSKIVDFEQELPKIKQAIKDSKVPNFQHLNKELNKNKPLSDVRKAMVNTSYLADVKFMVGDKVVHGHKMILITASYLFYQHFHVKGETEMTIDGINWETFEKVLNYCYSEKIQVTEADVLELLLASNQLQVRQITNVCHGFVSNMMNSDSIFMIFDKALEINNETFQKKCIDFINKNEVKCFTSKGFFAVSLPSLVKMLEVCKYPREKISEIVEKWTNGSMGMCEETPSPAPTIPLNNNMKKKPTGAVKKPQGKNQQHKNHQHQTKPLIPDLMSMPIPNPLFSFPPPPVFNQQPVFNQPPFQHFIPNPMMAQLVTFDDDDDQSVISKDDESVRVTVNGLRQQLPTEFARLDFVCKRSMLIHEIGFSENLAQKCKEVRLTVCVFDQNKRNDIHNRVMNNTKKPGMKTNFVRFSREPLKVYIGQKFFVKLNFSESVHRLNINPEKLSSNEILELRKDAEVKKYFNCISSLLVSEMTSS